MNRPGHTVALAVKRTFECNDYDARQYAHGQVFEKWRDEEQYE
jgi:hypothetical protein